MVGGSFYIEGVLRLTTGTEEGRREMCFTAEVAEDAEEKKKKTQEEDMQIDGERGKEEVDGWGEAGSGDGLYGRDGQYGRGQ